MGRFLSLYRIIWHHACTNCVKLGALAGQNSPSYGVWCHKLQGKELTDGSALTAPDANQSIVLERMEPATCENKPAG
jgi:hypothetical protein